ncbi:hypothetical protein AOX55_00002526 [Sinorhizobium fredii CCBAU 25509]|nr:hypothetical protein AOX55_00002526 [Sinorhizobium fredii CCBAU 25509]
MLRQLTYQVHVLDVRLKLVPQGNDLVFITHQRLKAPGKPR